MPALRPLVLALALPAAVHAAIQPINVLNKVEAPRAQAIGGAATAVGVDASLIWINPAAAALVPNSSISLAGQRGFFKESTGQILGSTPWRSGVVSAGAMYYDTGAGKLVTSSGAIRSMTLQQDLAMVLGYATSVGPKVTAGVSLKVIHSDLFGRVANAAGGDAGVQIRVAPMLKAGFAIQNVGTRLTYQLRDVDLPTTARAGLALGIRPAQFGIPTGASDTLLLLCDAVAPVTESRVAIKTGLEYRWNGMVSVRGGATAGGRRELSTYAAGMGVTVRRFRVDYSRRFGALLTTPQTLSLTFGFGGGAAPAPSPAIVAPVLPPPPQMGLTPPVIPDLQPPPAAVEPAPLPSATAADPKVPGQSTIDDLNRQLDELLHRRSIGHE